MLLPPVAGCAAAEASPPYYSHRWPGPAATVASHGNRTSEPSYSSPRGLPLLRLPRPRVVPFLALAVVHRRGALGVAWSMWSTAEFHRKSIVRGEAGSWVHGSCKEVPPYYAKIIIPPPDSGDPPDGPPYFTKKMFPPDCWDPPATSSHARKCVRAKTKKMIRPPDCWDPPATYSHARKCVRAKQKTKRFPPDCWDPAATPSHARKCVRAKKPKRFALLTAGTHQLHLRRQGTA